MGSNQIDEAPYAVFFLFIVLIMTLAVLVDWSLGCNNLLNLP